MPATYTVRICGDVTVSVDSAMLDVIGDPTLAEEITQEAVRIGVEEKLGGYSGFALQKANGTSTKPQGPTHVAALSFDAFAEALADNATRHDAATEALSAAHSAIELCRDRADTNTADEVRAMLDMLLKTTGAALQAIRFTEASGSVSACEGNEVRSATDDESSNGTNGDDDYEREREAMGYRPLMDEAGESEEERNDEGEH